MSNHTPEHDILSEEANRLYWESDESVNHIGEKMELSKGILYGLITPLPAGLPCPSCGEEMVFPNRTARNKGFLACPECGIEEEEAAVQSYWEEEGDVEGALSFPGPRNMAQRAGSAVQKAMGSGRDRVANMPNRQRTFAGIALLGVAAGLVLGSVLRKR
jgi:hypothetical protein